MLLLCTMRLLLVHCLDTCTIPQLWPLVSLINYKYVPLKLRVLVMQAIAFFW